MNGGLAMWKLFGAVLATLAISACSNPCHDYCEDLVKKAQQCGLGGPSGDGAIDECSDELNDTLTHDACSQGDDNVNAMSCDQFKSTVCSTSSASAYMCQ
jgi:hypothetical protein